MILTEDRLVNFILPPNILFISSLKTVQGNLGHATAAFTLDVYAHVTDEMKKASADRMEKYIKDVSDL